jgi:general secretion pathway protein A
MGYYGNLSLAREPFSNSPDPGMFYDSTTHLEALQQLEISIRLKRGLNVVTGNVGTGKTTLSRQLVQAFARDEGVDTVMILDPGYRRVVDFLAHILQLFTGAPLPPVLDENQIKERIKNHLFTRSADQGRLTVLIVDEGQKLTQPCLEALRELLNYETNDHKLLQIVIFAQNEFNATLEGLENLRDRVNFHYRLGALNFRDTRGLVLFRLERSFEPGKGRTLFTPGGFWALYRATRGYPRKIIRLCHHVMLALIIKEKRRADFFLVLGCAARVMPASPVLGRLVPVLGCLALAASGAALYLSRAGGDPSSGVIPEVSRSIDQAVAATSIQTRAPETGIRAASPEDPAERAPSQALPATGSPAAPTAPAQGPPDPAPPRVLGKLTIERNELFCDLVSAVYGLCTYSVIDEVLASNPGIKDPGTIIAGTTLVFPVPSFSFRAGDDLRYVVVLSTRKALDEAYAEVRRFRRGDQPLVPGPGESGRLGPLARYSSASGFPVRVLPAWSPDQGLCFHVVIDKPYDTREDAQAAAQGLPGLFPGVPEPLSSLGQQTLIFAKRND